MCQPEGAERGKSTAAPTQAAGQLLLAVTTTATTATAAAATVCSSVVYLHGAPSGFNVLRRRRRVFL